MVGEVRRLGSVRMRVTAAAALVSMIGLIGAAAWLVRSVESSLLGGLRDDAVLSLAEIQSLLASGSPGERIEVSAAPGMMFSVFDARGALVAASDGGGIRSGEAVAPPIRIVSTHGESPPAGGLLVAGPPNVVWMSSDGEFLQARADLPIGNEMFTMAASAPLASVRMSLAALQRSLWVAVPLLVAGMALLAWTVTGRALRPVASITGRVEEITHTTLHERVPEPSSHDEVARLARTMNRMLDRLEDAAERQRVFVSDASHELRSPIAAIRTEIEVARREPRDADWEAVTDVVLAEEGRLEGIVDDLLALVRADEGTNSPDGSADVALTVTAETERPRRVPVAADVAAAGEVALAVEHLRRVVAHLLDNATRHADTRVVVTATSQGGWVRLHVDDDGPGIPPEDRERVFDRFTRLDEGRARDAGGAGLGLAVVRSLVEAAGGTVVAAESPLGGARIEVRLPAAVSPARIA